LSFISKELPRTLVRAAYCFSGQKKKNAVGSNYEHECASVMNTYAVSGFYAIAVDEHAPANRPSLEPLK